MIVLNPHARYAVGVNIEGRDIRTGLVDLKANVTSLEEREIDCRNTRAMLDSVAAAIQGMLLDTPREKVVGVGIGITGLVDSETGTVIVASHLGLSHFPFRRVLAEALPLSVPILIDNDANAAALGERYSGAGRGFDNMVYIEFGTGIGAGIIIDGRIYGGTHGIAGEFGHLKLRKGGPKCACGARGCLEALAGGEAIVHEVLRETKHLRSSAIWRLADGDESKVTLRTILEAAAESDPLANNVLGRAMDYLGMGIANLINLLDVERIVIGGAGAYLPEPSLSLLRRSVLRGLLGNHLQSVTIIPAGLGKNSVIIGAATLALQRMGIVEPV
jgi:glucokinase-like ROK family protein